MSVAPGEIPKGLDEPFETPFSVFVIARSGLPFEGAGLNTPRLPSDKSLPVPVPSVKLCPVTVCAPASKLPVKYTPAPALAAVLAGIVTENV